MALGCLPTYTPKYDPRASLLVTLNMVPGAFLRAHLNMALGCLPPCTGAPECGPVLPCLHPWIWPHCLPASTPDHDPRASQLSPLNMVPGCIPACTPEYYPRAYLLAPPNHDAKASLLAPPEYGPRVPHCLPASTSKYDPRASLLAPLIMILEPPCLHP
jgi:hypothetical protein